MHQAASTNVTSASTSCHICCIALSDRSKCGSISTVVMPFPSDKLCAYNALVRRIRRAVCRGTRGCMSLAVVRKLARSLLRKLLPAEIAALNADSEAPLPALSPEALTLLWEGNVEQGEPEVEVVGAAPALLDNGDFRLCASTELRTHFSPTGGLC